MSLRLQSSPFKNCLTPKSSNNLTVNRPRIKKISISGYRASPPYRPTSFEVNLGNHGKNFLLYGENGSGKTSLLAGISGNNCWTGQAAVKRFFQSTRSS